MSLGGISSGFLRPFTSQADLPATPEPVVHFEQRQELWDRYCKLLLQGREGEADQALAIFNEAAHLAVLRQANDAQRVREEERINALRNEPSDEPS